MLFIGTFRQLENAASPLFARCLSVLELVGQVRFVANLRCTLAPHADPRARLQLRKQQLFQTLSPSHAAIACFVFAVKHDCLSAPTSCRSIALSCCILQVKCCVLMLDWNDEDLICDLFQVLCEAIK